LLAIRLVVAANYCLLLSSLSSFEGILSLGIGIEGGNETETGSNWLEFIIIIGSY
jgi:hypothetical protein